MRNILTVIDDGFLDLISATLTLVFVLFRQVIANADLSYVYTHLLDDEDSKRWVKGLKYTSSAICFYWGVDKQFPELETHNMFLAEDFKGSFDEIFKSHSLPAEPSFYIFSAPRTDPTGTCILSLNIFSSFMMC